VQLLARLEVAHKKALILTDGVKPMVYLSGRNLQNVVVMPYSDASTYDILWSDVVLVEAGAIGHELSPVAEKAVEKVKVKKSAAKAPKAEKAVKAAATAKKAAAKKAAAPKAAAKKAPAKKAAAKPAAKKAAAKKAAPKKKEK
jgi:pyruvate/2-oxoglutarate dehydrogenase complex dihydrolipoamide acyltransferase (E2) component